MRTTITTRTRRTTTAVPIVNSEVKGGREYCGSFFLIKLPFSAKKYTMIIIYHMYKLFSILQNAVNYYNIANLLKWMTACSVLS